MEQLAEMATLRTPGARGTAGRKRPKQSAKEKNAARPSDDGQRYRVQVDFAEAAYRELRSIQRLAGEKSMTQVIRRALHILGWYLSRRQEGFRLQLVKQNQIIDVDLGF
jgi:hypothetical protein